MRTVGNGRFLKPCIDRDCDRFGGRGHRNLVCAHHGFCEVLQRPWLIVPLRVIADDRKRILRRVRCRNAGRTFGRVQMVAHQDDHGNTVAPSIVNRHRRVLKPYGPVKKPHHGLTGNFEVAMRHRSAGLFMHDRQHLRFDVHAVIGQRFVDAAAARGRIGGDVVDVQSLYDIDHEVRARPSRSVIRYMRNPTRLGCALRFTRPYR